MQKEKGMFNYMYLTVLHLTSQYYTISTDKTPKQCLSITEDTQGYSYLNLKLSTLHIIFSIQSPLNYFYFPSNPFMH